MNSRLLYGRGMAPLFFGIAIWVFAIAVFLVMRPISGRALAGRASSWRISMAGWLPVVGIASLGALLLLGIVWGTLGLDPVNVGGAIGVAIVSTVAVSQADGSNPLAALTNGFQSAFATAIIFAAVGLLAAVAVLGKLRLPTTTPAGEPAEA